MYTKMLHWSERSRVDLLAFCALPRFRQILGGVFALMLAQAGWCAAEHNPLLPRPQEIHYGG